VALFQEAWGVFRILLPIIAKRGDASNGRDAMQAKAQTEHVIQMARGALM